MVFAEFITRGDSAEAIAAYREAFQPSIFRQTPWAGVGMGMLAADTDEEAERLDAPRRAWSRAFAEGNPGAFMSIDAAQADLKARGAETPSAEERRFAIVGDGPTVRAGLQAKAEIVGADELFLITFAPTLEAGVRSLELTAPTLTPM